MVEVSFWTSRTLAWLLLATSVGHKLEWAFHLDHYLSSAGVAVDLHEAMELWSWSRDGRPATCFLALQVLATQAGVLPRFPSGAFALESSTIVDMYGVLLCEIFGRGSL